MEVLSPLTEGTLKSYIARNNTRIESQTEFDFEALIDEKEIDEIFRQL